MHHALPCPCATVWTGQGWQSAVQRATRTDGRARNGGTVARHAAVSRVPLHPIFAGSSLMGLWKTTDLFNKFWFRYTAKKQRSFGSDLVRFFFSSSSAIEGAFY